MTPHLVRKVSQHIFDDVLVDRGVQQGLEPCNAVLCAIPMKVMCVGQHDSLTGTQLKSVPGEQAVAGAEHCLNKSTPLSPGTRYAPDLPHAPPCLLSFRASPWSAETSSKKLAGSPRRNKEIATFHLRAAIPSSLFNPLVVPHDHFPPSHT